MTFIIICYDTFCGGLGDRIVGLVSAIYMCQKLNKKLLIKWDYPDITNVFDISKYDYYKHIPQLKQFLNRNGTHATLHTKSIPVYNTSPTNQNPNVVVLNTIDNRFKYESLLRLEPLQKMWANKTIFLKCNQEIGMFLHQNKHLPKSQELDYEQAIPRIYKTIFTEYLKPPVFNLSQQAGLGLGIGLESPYIGVQLRTGDSYMNVGGHRPVQDVNQTIQKISNFIKNQYPSIQHIYLTSDHPDAKKIFSQHLPHHTVYDTPQSRFHFERTKADQQKMQSLILDLNYLIHAEHLIISSYSNYGRMAALMSISSQPIRGFSPPDFQVKTLPVKVLFSKEPNVKPPPKIALRKVPQPKVLPRKVPQPKVLPRKVLPVRVLPRKVLPPRVLPRKVLTLRASFGTVLPLTNNLLFTPR
jgi:hypothetical protein